MKWQRKYDFRHYHHVCAGKVASAVYVFPVCYQRRCSQALDLSAWLSQYPNKST